jgi:hypothetical protein
VIACEGRVHAGFGAQVRRRVGDCLDPWLFVIGSDREGIGRRGLLDDPDLATDAQNLSHLLLEFWVAALRVIAALMRLDLLSVEDFTQGALCQLGKGTDALLWPMLTRMAG